MSGFETIFDSNGGVSTLTNANWKLIFRATVNN